MKRRAPSFDALRVIAALLVVLFHLRFVGGPDLGPLSRGGFPGVALFFSLSGYLITQSASGDVRSFAVLRVARLWPAYVVALVGLTAIGGSSEFPDHGLAYLTLTQNYDVATYHRLITPAWTLAIEVAFYALAPVLVRLPLVVTAILGAVSGGAWWLLLTLMPSSSFENFIVLGTFPFMFWLFVPGSIVARVHIPHRGALVAGIALVLVGLLADELTNDARGRLTLAFGGPALGGSLLILARPHVPFGRLWAAGAAVSYSVYLWHHDLLRIAGPWGALFALGVATAAYLMVERPVMGWARRFVDRHYADTGGHREGPKAPVPWPEPVADPGPTSA